MLKILVLRPLKAFHQWISEQMKLRDFVTNEFSKIVDLFVAFFQSVYLENDVNSVRENTQIPDVGIICDYIIIDVVVILNKLENVDINKGEYPDNHPPIFLGNCSPTLALHLLYIHRLLYQIKTFPTIRKKANITPKFKMGNKIHISNNCPVSTFC